MFATDRNYDSARPRTMRCDIASGKRPPSSESTDHMPRMALAELRWRLPRGLPGRIINAFVFPGHHSNLPWWHKKHRAAMAGVMRDFTLLDVESCGHCRQDVCTIFSVPMLRVIRTFQCRGSRIPTETLHVYLCHGITYDSKVDPDETITLCWSCFKQGRLPDDARELEHGWFRFTDTNAPCLGFYENGYWETRYLATRDDPATCSFPPGQHPWYGGEPSSWWV